MKELMEQHGDAVLAAVVGMLFMVLLFGMIADGGLLSNLLAAYEAKICVMLPVMRGGIW